MITVILLAEYSCKLALGIFNLMALINYDVLPIVLVESQSVLKDEVIGSDAHIPLRALHLLQNIIAGRRVTPVNDLPDRGRPLIKLRHPVRDGG